MRAALRRGRAAGLAERAAAARRAGGGRDDFAEAAARLAAETAYSPRFRRDLATELAGAEGVAGAVAGATVAWADGAAAAFGLQRRAVLRWARGGEPGAPPRSVLLVKKPGDAAAAAKLREVGDWLLAHGARVLVERAVLAAEIQAGGGAGGGGGASPSSSSRSTGGGSYEAFDPADADPSPSGRGPAAVELAVTLGGDGTVLHLASLFAAVDDAPLPPVVSFAMGSLGFLTPFAAGTARGVLSRLLWPPWDGEPVYATLRSRRRVEVHAGGALQAARTVLNEVLVDRGASPSMVELEAFVDGRHLTTVQADGLIIATPSGSTAYSMSAGGPMAAPSVPCTILTPVAPHSLSFRPLVVPEDSVVEVHVPRGARVAPRTSFDGRHAARLPRDAALVVRAAKYALPMVNMHALDEDWYEGITAKLRWTGALAARGGGRAGGGGGGGMPGR